MFDLVVVGDANPDVIVGPLTEPLAFGQREQVVRAGVLTPGGSAAIVACGAARLGLSVALVGRVGADDAGDYLRAALGRRGVDTTALVTDPTLSTPLTAIVTMADDRAMLTATGTLAATTVADVPVDLLTGCRHVHVASYFLMPKLAAGLPGLFRLARRHGVTTSLDTNDDPSGEWDLGGVLTETDLLLPNANEAMRLAGVPSPVAAAAALAARGPLVVVKDGAAGAFCHTGRTVSRTKGITVTPVDSVGAGDSFDAGFIAATLRGMSTRQALDLAAVCGALSTMDHGGTTCQPTWADAVRHLEHNGAT